MDCRNIPSYMNIVRTEEQNQHLLYCAFYQFHTVICCCKIEISRRISEVCYRRFPSRIHQFTIRCHFPMFIWRTRTLHSSEEHTCFVLSRDLVTIDGVLIRNRIYWTLTIRNYDFTVHHTSEIIIGHTMYSQTLSLT
jgi:hypothetical protein